MTHSRIIVCLFVLSLLLHAGVVLKATGKKCTKRVAIGVCNSLPVDSKNLKIKSNQVF